MCWFRDDPPAEITVYFDNVYPDIKPVAEVRRLIAESGYELVGDFNLPDSAWWDDYYTPLLARQAELRRRNATVEAAQEIYRQVDEEIEMFRRHSSSYGYTFFVARRV